MFDLIKTAIQLNQHDEDRRITLRSYSMRQMITWFGMLSLTGSKLPEGSHIFFKLEVLLEVNDQNHYSIANQNFLIE